MYKIADMHCDTIMALFERQNKGENIHLLENPLHIDLNKLKNSNYLVQNFALFVYLPDVSSPYETAIAMAELYQKEILENASIIRPALSYQDILSNDANGYISSILTLEEGEILEGNLDHLKTFYDKGVRMMTLTWNFKNQLGSPSVHMENGNTPDFYLPDTENGLTPLGIQCVEEAERLGIILDVSHLSDAGFYDVLSHTKKPFAASHSNARTICPNIRNMTDHMIHCLADRGGVMGLNFCPAFLSDRLDGSVDKGTIDSIVRHAKHIINIGGSECLGLGTDFDGIDGHEELKNASYMQNLFFAMEKAGFSADLIDRIAYKNVMRLYKDTL